MLFPPIVRPGTRRAATEDDIAQLAADSERISALRIRLCSLSEFHKALKEPLARLVNREEGVTGPFWGSRFKCRRVLDAPARLMTMAYVDMNPIRAKVARTPEESRFTGIWHRAKALKERLAERPKPSSRRRRPRGAAIARSLSRTGGESTHPFLTPIQSTPSRRGVFSDMTSEQYVAFVDRLGRVVRADKRGSIPPGIAPILQRLELDAHQFLEQVASTAKWFGSVVGTQESCAVEAERCRRRRVLSAVRLGAD